MSPFKFLFLSTTNSFSIRFSCKISFDFERGVPSGIVTKSSWVIKDLIFLSSFVSNLKSRLVRIPTSFFFWVIGMPVILYFFITSSASLIFCSGSMVIGSGIMALTDRFTLSTILRCLSGFKFLWMMPMPPSWASAMARFVSVTVSIGAPTNGHFSLIFRVKRVQISTSVGKTLEYAGSSKTSSKVR